MERLENNVKDAENKRSIILAVVGPATYRLLHSLIAPAKPRDKSYDNLVSMLGDHFNQTPSGVKFHHSETTIRRKDIVLCGRAPIDLGVL